MGTVISIQRFSLGDGPGIRTTVFLKGCPLRCPWCSNPESQSFRPEPGYRSAMCIHCGTCVKACPQGAVRIADGRIAVDRSRCVGCGQCAEHCPAGALTMYGTEMSADEVLRTVRKDMRLYLRSGGGMTLSGGEPLGQIDFAEELLRGAKAGGIRTCIETTGCGDLARLLPWLDAVFFDVKAADPAEHRALTGVTNEQILRSLAAAVRSGRPLTVRVPMIPGYNASPDQLAAIAELVGGQGVRTLEIMPYHEYGLGKYEAVGREYAVKSRKPTEEELAGAAAIFQGRGIECSVSER